MDLWRILFVRKSKGISFGQSFGYFFSHLKDPQKTLDAILNTKITLFPGHIQSVYYQNILKILTFLIQSLGDEEILIQQLILMTIDKMTVFLSSGDVEAQERVG